jgi:hypothetical protein
MTAERFRNTGLPYLGTFLDRILKLTRPLLSLLLAFTA